MLYLITGLFGLTVKESVFQWPSCMHKLKGHAVCIEQMDGRDRLVYTLFLEPTLFTTNP
jgi:hypothetical protein